MKWVYGLLALLLAALVWLSVPLSAQQWRYQKTQADVTVAGSAIGIFCTIGASTCDDVNAAAGHVQATLGYCSLTGGNIRVTTDGTTVTTSVGTVLTPGVWWFTSNAVLLNAQATRDDSTSGTLSCTVVGQ